MTSSTPTSENRLNSDDQDVSDAQKKVTISLLKGIQEGNSDTCQNGDLCVVTHTGKVTGGYRMPNPASISDACVCAAQWLADRPRHPSPVIPALQQHFDLTVCQAHEAVVLAGRMRMLREVFA